MAPNARLLAVVLALLAVLHGAEAAGDYKADTLSVLLFTGVFVLCLLITYVLLQSRLAYLPESLVHILLGIVIGGIIYGTGREIEDLIAFNPRTFFLFLLPPIVFHAGYDLHKGNFFKNLGSILVFAVLGTLVSAFVFGGIIYALGKAHLSKDINFLDSLVFGSIVACIDPVATLAIFTALNVEPTLHMLVFGESVLNDAVSITLYRTFAEYAAGGAEFNLPELGLATLHFCIMTFGSVFIGVATALVSALVHKYIHLKMYPSLEISFVFVFAYIPYLIAEVLKLSGVMSILFGGIVMAHYTHFNLSPVSQITVQQAFHMFAYICETTVFIYLGMAVFGYTHSFHGGLIFWSILLAFLARAANVFPLGALVNQFRTIKISREHMFVLWFSGLRGALAFAMALNFGNPHIMSATLIMCLFTIVTLGGSTLPLLKYLSRRGGQVFNSKISIGMTEMGKPMDFEAVESLDQHASAIGERESWFERIDRKYMQQFFRSSVTPPFLMPHSIQSHRWARSAHAGKDVPMPHSASSPSMFESSQASAEDLAQDRGAILAALENAIRPPNPRRRGEVEMRTMRLYTNDGAGTSSSGGGGGGEGSSSAAGAGAGAGAAAPLGS
eukprot:tig00000057_g54.t1